MFLQVKQAEYLCVTQLASRSTGCRCLSDIYTLNIFAKKKSVRGRETVLAGEFLNVQKVFVFEDGVADVLGGIGSPVVVILVGPDRSAPAVEVGDTSDDSAVFGPFL